MEKSLFFKKGNNRKFQNSNNSHFLIHKTISKNRCLKSRNKYIRKSISNHDRESETDEHETNSEIMEYDPLEEHETSMNIRVIGNNIYFYEEVDVDTILQLNIEIDKLNKKFEKTEYNIIHKLKQSSRVIETIDDEFKYKFNNRKIVNNHQLNETLDAVMNEYINDKLSNLTINIHINSPGGCVYSGLSGYHHIKNSKYPINTFVDGYAASAATFLLMAGKKRYMNNMSYVRIHQLSNGIMGKWEEIQDETSNCEKYMNTIKEMYLKHTKISKKQLDSLIKREIDLNSSECIKYKIIDEIIE